jgi:hypothetical protein
MVSPQFQGAAAGTALGDAFSGQNDQSVVFTWDGTSYTKYTYFAGFGWFDEFFASADAVVIGAGEGVWLADSTGGADVIISGEAPQASSVTNSLVAGFNMVANPYPVAMTLGELPAASLSDQDVVFTWNGAGYNKYTYFAGFGWFDEFFASADAVELSVGESAWLDSSAGGLLVLDKQY